MIILIGLQLGGTLGLSPTHLLSGQPSTLANAFCIPLKPMMMSMMIMMMIMMMMMMIMMTIMMIIYFSAAFNI